MQLTKNLLQNPSKSVQQIQTTYKFPLSTMSELDDLEKKIVDPVEQTKLVGLLFTKITKVFISKILSVKFSFIFKVDDLTWLGGSTPPEAIRLIMEHLFTNELALQFAWEGIRKINPKRPFKQLKIKNVIFGNL